MKKLFTLLLFVGALSYGQDKMNIIKGKITYFETPLVNAEIKVLGTEKSVKSDITGSYQIEARPGQIITYSYPSMRTMEILVEDVTRILNIELTPEVNQLDEVVVSKTVLKSQKQLSEEYTTNRHLINTAYGILDEETAPGKISILTKEDMTFPGICILDLLRMRFSGVEVSGFCNTGGNVVIRNAGISSLNNAVPTIFDVDGQIFTDTPLWILPENIERIAVLNSRSVATRYGALGAGGVVIINTNVGNYFQDSDTGIPYDRARLRNNKFENDALLADDLKRDDPKYLIALRESINEEEAITLFNEKAASYRNSFQYFLDAYTYFSQTWKNAKFAKSIISENRRLFDNNSVALKALAYTYQADEMYKEANELFKDIFILRPNYAQSYLDLANSYRDIGEYQKSAAIFARYGYLLEQGFLRAEDDLGIIMDREFNNLLALKGKELLSNKELNNIILDDEFDGTRLVFEWNDGEAEFELQFVNPEGNYFKSEHTLTGDADRIKKMKLMGFSTDEFLIDTSLQGIWQVNAKYLGNKSLTPTYLKATIYHDYNKASQRKEIKVFKLSLRNVNQQLFTISNSDRVVSN